ncbi:protein FAM200B-like [Stegodyphus dumicola]|uniref:protein FAM200B-like n=1 Tax=Stegodyphus dumicola TaxID=202533 RepID=UPI0015ACD1F2|nr:protein FAM200B-like [Stegodyphus dumicola]
MDKWLIKKTTDLNDDDQPSTSKAEHHDHAETVPEAPKANIQRQNNKRKATWTINYCDEYLRFGFIARGSQNNLLLCVICNEQLSNESMRPPKLKRHLNILHSEYSDESNNFFTDKKKELIAAQKNEKYILSSPVK